MKPDSGRKPFLSARRMAFIVAVAGWTAAQGAESELAAGGGYLDLSLEQLMQIDVTTVAGTPEPRFAAPAALTVIGGDDMRRAGHRSIAEALRMVPGLYVARINASSYTIGARGLTGSAVGATRYLVLVDGRVVHDPLLSVTFWDTVDLGIQDVDRIEVIRGPGATLWGANAMNGVINVISKTANETQGTLLSLSPGDVESTATVRHGASFGQTAVRGYVRYTDRDAFDLERGPSNHDGYSTLRLGVRADRAHSPRTTFTIDADIYQHPTADQSVRLPVPDAHFQFRQLRSSDDFSGGHFLFRAQHQLSADAGFSFQTYYDQIERDTVNLGLERNTVDADFRHWLKWGARQDFIWGLQFTQHDDRLDNTEQFIFDPDSRYWRSFNAFAQNTTALIENRVFAMLGSKLTYHDFVGWEVQPGARLWWTPSERQTIWSAVSRPVRVPSRLEREGLIAFVYADTGLLANMEASGNIVPLGLGGNDDLESERLIAYELGHRYRHREGLVLETSLFYNDYRRLIAPPAALIGTFVDEGEAETYGGELAASIRPLERLQIDAAYSYVGVQVRGPVLASGEENQPRHLGKFRASWKLHPRVELNAASYYVSKAEAQDIDAYLRADLGVIWDLRPGIRLAFWGQNLTDPEHREAAAVEIPRSFYARLLVEL